MDDDTLDGVIGKLVREALKVVAGTGRVAVVGAEFQAAADGGRVVTIELYAVPKGQRLPEEAIPLLGEIRVAIEQAGRNALQTKFEVGDQGKEVVVMVGPKSILTKAKTEPMHVPDNCRGLG